MPLPSLLRYTARDIFPILSAFGHLLCLAGTFVFFHNLPVWVLALAFGAIIFNYCWNVQSIRHSAQFVRHFPVISRRR